VLTLRLAVYVRCSSCGAQVPFGAVAPTSTCPACRGKVSLDASAWRSVLADVRKASTTLLELETRTLGAEGAAVRTTVWREPLRCGGCRAPFPPDRIPALGEAAPLFCGGCGRPSARRAVADLGTDVSFFGEDAAAASFVVFVDAEPTTDRLGSWTWVNDAVVDDAGNSYLTGTLHIEWAENDVDDDDESQEERIEAAIDDDDEGGPENQDEPPGDRGVWSVDAQLKVRWLNRIGEADRITLLGDRVFAWRGEAKALLLCEDGRRLSVPEHAPFDAAGNVLQRDTDGSYISDGRYEEAPGDTAFSRHSATGERLADYPEKPTGFFHAVAGAFHDDPLRVGGPRKSFTLLPDGSIAALIGRDGAKHAELVRVDRRGVASPRTVVPATADTRDLRLYVDAAGRILFLDRNTLSLLVLAPTPAVLLAGEPLTASSCLAVARDGSFWIFDAQGAAYHYRSDGHPLSARAAPALDLEGR
jgi:hypothetical protein